MSAAVDAQQHAHLSGTGRWAAGGERKRRRLSRLLERLAEQLRNNNQYEEDAQPLDLSVRRAERHECAACGQTFALRDRLAKHIASRHRPGKAANEPRAHQCTECGRRFARSDMLSRHLRLHSGARPYACACGAEFSRSDHLATHRRTHTGEKPYACPACPYSAARRDMITRHMRTHLPREQTRHHDKR